MCEVVTFSNIFFHNLPVICVSPSFSRWLHANSRCCCRCGDDSLLAI